MYETNACVLFIDLDEPLYQLLVVYRLMYPECVVRTSFQIFRSMQYPFLLLLHKCRNDHGRLVNELYIYFQTVAGMLSNPILHWRMQGRHPLLPQLPADRGEIQPYVGVPGSSGRGHEVNPPTMLTAVANTVDNGMGVGGGVKPLWRFDFSWILYRIIFIWKVDKGYFPPKIPFEKENKKTFILLHSFISYIHYVYAIILEYDYILKRKTEFWKIHA